ncbi:PIN domain-containing protein [Limnohabitans sp. Rim8]|uniref:PIN domain-containing protein n=1 Tax=Limnohabitans sp. Rim8 TaxID=1100718 RepID=UPI00261176A7|nr:type II toxin-antitoxin system VapC family toxin [Limnohabitans sp. Rim8]
MIAGSVDTNVLVRLLTQDDATQAQAVDKLIAKYTKKGDLLFVPITVVLELEWVLRSRLEQSKPQLIATFSALLTMVEFSFESEDAVEQALADFEDGNADFGEYLHLAISRKNQALPFWTFDRKASRTQGAKSLT